MNKAILMGRLTRDPEVRYTGEKTTVVARFTLAVERLYKKEQDLLTADFISCVAFGRQGEFAEKYLRKGIKIAINGRIQTGNYKNKDGQKVYTTDIIVEEFEFAESKSANEQHMSSGRVAGKPSNALSEDGFINIPDDIDEDLPFK